MGNPHIKEAWLSTKVCVITSRTDQTGGKKADFEPLFQGLYLFGIQSDSTSMLNDLVLTILKLFHRFNLHILPTTMRQRASK